MNKHMNQKPVLENQQVEQAEEKPTAYEAPRITRKRSLERVTLASGTFAPGGTIGGD
jgi:hypothetical protein